jgi:hypothetical protein
LAWAGAVSRETVSARKYEEAIDFLSRKKLKGRQ